MGGGDEATESPRERGLERGLERGVCGEDADGGESGEGAELVKVAVKVQHRDICTVMLQDLAQSEVLAFFLALAEPNFDFQVCIMAN